MIKPNQPGITQFIERELKEDLPIKFIGTKRPSSQSSAHKLNAPEENPGTESATKKRTRSVVSSPDSSTERQPNKRLAFNMEDNEEMMPTKIMLI